MKKANGSGSIRKRIDTRNGRSTTYWEGQLRLNNGKRKTVCGKTQAEVRKKLTEIQNKVDEQRYVDIPHIKLADWLDLWLEEYIKPSVKISTYTSYKSKVSSSIKPGVGDYLLSEMNVPILQRFANSLTRDRGLAPKTVNMTLAILQEALKQAVELDYLPMNPMERVKRPKVIKKEVRPLAEDEIRKLLERLEDGSEYYANAIKLILFTGLREGEACGLAWEDIDWSHGTITVRRQLSKNRETGKYMLTTAKEDKTRLIRCAPAVLGILRAQKRDQEAMRHDAGMFWRNDDGLVFTGADGTPVPSVTLYKHIKAHMIAIGRPDAYVHTLRHTYAVTSLQEGDDIKTVQANLGHATAAFTLDVYGHVSDRMRQESADRMQRFIERVQN